MMGVPSDNTVVVLVSKNWLCDFDWYVTGTYEPDELKYWNPFSVVNPTVESTVTTEVVDAVPTTWVLLFTLKVPSIEPLDNEIRWYFLLPKNISSTLLTAPVAVEQ